VKSAARPSFRTPIARALAPIFVITLVWGWATRDELYVTAERGAGYALGIVGLACMTLLLAYSVRKRWSRIRGAGPLRHWFAVHMLLGVVGPIAILFHANFRMGSLNSTVALLCVVLVAASGVAGRLIYPRIHFGLYGRRVSVRDLEGVIANAEGAVARIGTRVPELARIVEDFRSDVESAGSHRAGIRRIVRTRTRARAARRACVDALGRSATSAQDADEAMGILSSYFDNACRVAEFGAYERVFSLWHAVHMPLCVMLFLAAAVHVVAVHLY
jgi:hypothetical protein